MGTRSSLGVKRLGCGIDYPPPCSAKVEGRVFHTCLYKKHTERHKSSSLPSAPYLGVTEPVFGNSYPYMKHTKQHERNIVMSIPNLGLVQPVFGNSYLYVKHTKRLLQDISVNIQRC
jgi:hypothetical protein